MVLQKLWVMFLTWVLWVGGMELLFILCVVQFLLFSVRSAGRLFCFCLTLRLRRTVVRDLKAQQASKSVCVCQGGLICSIRCIMELFRETSTSYTSPRNRRVLQIKRLIVRAFRCQDRFVHSYSTCRGRVDLAQANAYCFRPRTNRIVADNARYRGFSATAANYRDGQPR